VSGSTLGVVIGEMLASRHQSATNLVKREQCKQENDGFRAGISQVCEDLGVLDSERIDLKHDLYLADIEAAAINHELNLKWVDGNKNRDYGEMPETLVKNGQGAPSLHSLNLTQRDLDYYCKKDLLKLKKLENSCKAKGFVQCVITNEDSPENNTVRYGDNSNLVYGAV
jgi:hypothetical protein